MSVTSSKVVIVGGGITGPVLALLLKQKGWNPVIVEKVKDLGATGLAIAIHPNGLKVLNKAGVAKELLGGTLPWLKWNEYTSNGEFLGGPGSDLPATWAGRYGWPAAGISRTKIQLCLRDIVMREGVEYHQGWRLKEIWEKHDGIVAVSEEGHQIEASFLIGCDGLKSATREILLAKKGIENKEPNFTGIAVIGGNCPTPPFQQHYQGVNNWYGATTCVISHPIEDSKSVWGLSFVPDAAVAESWRTIPQEELQTEVARLVEKFREWPEPVTAMIAGSTKVQTIGLYDRPELPVEQWYHDRIMLLGDAAHPTTPHIGQGANQGLEDCWALAQQLPIFDSSSKQGLSLEQLRSIFRNVAIERQPNTSAVVTAARAAGEKRVIRGGEADIQGRKQRDDQVRASWQDIENLRAVQDSFYFGPFDDLSGYDEVKM